MQVSKSYAWAKKKWFRWSKFINRIWPHMPVWLQEGWLCHCQTRGSQHICGLNQHSTPNYWLTYLSAGCRSLIHSKCKPQMPCMPDDPLLSHRPMWFQEDGGATTKHVVASIFAVWTSMQHPTTDSHGHLSAGCHSLNHSKRKPHMTCVSDDSLLLHIPTSMGQLFVPRLILNPRISHMYCVYPSFESWQFLCVRAAKEPRKKVSESQAVDIITGICHYNLLNMMCKYVYIIVFCTRSEALLTYLH